MTEELAVIDLVTRRDPSVVLEEARKAAVAIKTVIDGKPDKVVMNGQTYLEFEDWQTLGRFYGLATEIEWTKPVAFGDVQGWEASAVVKLVATSQVVSRAEAMCLNDEEKWRARPKYEWEYCLKNGGTSAEDPGTDHMIWEPNPNKPGKNRPKKTRVLIGEEVVPMFQLRSMAQTRAAAKAFRNVLSWVVVLAGYKPTPAEELDGLGAERVVNEPADVTKGEQPTSRSPLPAGAAYIERLTTTDTKNANVKRTSVLFSDGVEASLFDTKRVAEIQALYDETAAVIYVTKQKGRFVNLVSVTRAQIPPTTPSETAIPGELTAGEIPF